MAQRPKIEPTPQNILAVRERYYGKPALFMEEILGMDLDDWQRDLADSFHSKNRFAVSSGHSSGKTAFVAGIIIYFISVHPDPQIVVTANTEQQLRQKTWRELAKWHNNSLVRDWFTWTATTYSLKGAEETWFAAGVPNTPHGAEGFAGTHEKYILQIFDEASAIERIIWETAEGATATPGGYRKWLVFGNPTRSDGAFFDCFHKLKHRWDRRFLDTRQCKYADQSQIADWEADYGEDSDFFRVRVRGIFPKQSIVQLISFETASAATARFVDDEAYSFAPKVIGVDVARFGDDATVITMRQGLKMFPQIVLRGKNTMEVADRVAQEAMQWNPQAIMVDAIGLGAGVCDRLRQLNFSVLDVVSSEAAEDKRFLNKRIEMWSEMADWLAYASIEAGEDMISDLTSPEYFYNGKGKMQLESKDSMKKRGLSSPDRADSLALTFAYPVSATVKEKFLTQAEKDWLVITGLSQQSGKVCNLED